MFPKCLELQVEPTPAGLNHDNRCTLSHLFTSMAKRTKVSDHAQAKTFSVIGSEGRLNR
jgi:hypothetical protein